MRSLSTRSLRLMTQTGEKQRQRNYDLHIRKVLEIQTAQNQKRIAASQTKIASNLRKSKEISRKFQLQETATQRREADKKLIQTLIEIDRKPRIKAHIQSRPKAVSKETKKLKLQTLPSRAKSKEKMWAQQRISNQNVRLAKSIMSSANHVKQYKKKMRTEIDEYLKLRTHIQKFKPSEVKGVEQRRPSKTAGQLLALIKQKTEEVQRNQSRIDIAVPEGEIQRKQRQLML